MPEFDMRELLDAYDKVRQDGLTRAVAKELARAHPDVFVSVVNTLTKDRALANSLGEFDAETFDNDIDQLIRSGQKIEAIKKVRERSMIGLKQAKEMVESRLTQLEEEGNNDRIPF